MYHTRRDFIATTGALALSAASMPALTLSRGSSRGPQESNVALYKRLLTQWCNAMVNLQS